MKAKHWFRAQGQRMAGLGLPLQLSPLWKHRNAMPEWAWRAFTDGYDQQMMPASLSGRALVFVGDRKIGTAKNVRLHVSQGGTQ